MDKKKIERVLELTLVKDKFSAERLHLQAERMKERAMVLERAAVFMSWFHSDTDSPCPLSRLTAKRLANDLVEHFCLVSDDFACKYRENYDVLEITLNRDSSVSYDIIEVIKILDLLADYELV